MNFSLSDAIISARLKRSGFIASEKGKNDYFSFKFYFERNETIHKIPRMSRREASRKSREMIIWWVFIISAASTPLPRYLSFCLNAIGNRFNFIPLRPCLVPLSQSVARSVLSLLFFPRCIWHEFLFSSIARRIEWALCSVRSFFYFSFALLCSVFVISKALQSLKTSTNWLILIAKRFVYVSLWLPFRLMREVFLPRRREWRLRWVLPPIFFFLPSPCIAGKHVAIEWEISFHFLMGKCCSIIQSILFGGALD